jgi:hypothetical protein
MFKSFWFHIIFIGIISSISSLPAKEINLRPETLNFFKHVYMDDTDAYLNLAMNLWEEEQAGGDYLWDINLLPLPKEELKGAIEVFMWDFKRNSHPDFEYYGIVYMLTGRFQSEGISIAIAKQEMQENSDYLCNEGLICNLNIY